MPTSPASLALWRANSLSELLTTALQQNRTSSLAQPISLLWEGARLPPALAFFLQDAAKELSLATVKAVLEDRELWRMLKSASTTRDRAALLHRAKAVIDAVPPDPQPVGTRNRPLPASQPAPALEKLPHSAQDWRAFATQASVPDALFAPLTVLNHPQAAALATTQLRHLSLLDLVSHASRDRGLKPLLPAVMAYLKGEVAECRAAEQEELHRGGHDSLRDDDRVLAPIAAQLHSLRSELRKEVAPTLRKRIDEGKLSVELDPLVFRYLDGRLQHDYGRLPRGAAVQLLIDSKQIRPGCNCILGQQNHRCRHQLAAIDAALIFLHAANENPTRAELKRHLAAPEWERTLRLIERPNDKRARPQWGADWRLLWKLEEAPNAWSEHKLKPVLQRPAKRGEGWANAPAPSLEALVNSDSPLVGSEDRQAALMLLSDVGRSSGLVVVSALSLLARSGRVFADLEGEGPAMLQIVEAPLGLSLQENEHGFHVVASVAGEPLDEELLDSLAARTRAQVPMLYLASASGRCFIIRPDLAASRALEVLEKRANTFPKEAGPILADRLDDLGIKLTVPASLRGELQAPLNAPSVFLKALDGLTYELELRVRPLAQGLSFPVGEGPSVIRGRLSDRRIFTERDFDHEREAATALWAALTLELLDDRFRAEISGERVLALVRRLEELAKDGLEVVWPARRPTFARPAQLKDVRLNVSAGRDWFGLNGTVSIDGDEISLASLLEAARQKQRFVRVRDEHFAELSAELAARLAPVAELVFDGKHGTEVSLAAASPLKALEQDVGAFSADKSFVALADQMRASAALEVKLPRGIKAQLRPYQLEGFQWLAKVASWGAGACLADDMGLGKTLQVLALLVQRQSLGPALVVAPTSVCFNWEKEAEKFAPGLRVIRYHHVDRQSALASLGPKDVLVTSYGLLTRDSALFSQTTFATLVLDEAQAVKNAATQRAKVVREVKADFRVAMTGTPLENHLGELWSLFRAVLPGLFGSEEQFRQRLWIPIEREKNAGRQRALQGMLKPFLLRRTKGEVARDLPPRIEVEVPVVLSPEERNLYEQARLAIVAALASDLVADGKDRRFQVLAGLTRLRLLACHPSLHDPSWSGRASKLERLLELVEQLRDEGHRALIFSQFTKHLAVVRAALSERGVSFQYLDGETPEAERQRRVEAFQNGNDDVFLISLKAGGAGLNLTAADNVIHLDPWWNPAVEDQATDRAHRIGQTKPVTVYRLVTQGTLEEAILKLHAQKRELVAGVLEGTGVASRLGTEELAALLEASGRVEADAPGPTAMESARGASRA